MLYKTYGSTGLKVSVIGFGAMRFPSEDYAKGPEKAAELVLRAHEMGVNYFDTAPGYCDQKSESILGCAFGQLKRDSFYVSTKCGLWNATDAIEARRMIEQSLTRMKLSKIDFYHLWSIKNMEEYRAFMRKGGVFEGVQKAKEEGLIRHICASTHASGADIEAIAKDGLVDGILLGYNAINFAYRRQGVAAAHAEGLGVVVMNPLGGGVIPRHAKRFSFIKDLVPGASLPQAALAFLIGQDAVTVALPGIANAAELEENVAAAEMGAPVSDAELDALALRLREELDALCTGCGYCDSCPSGVPIPKLMDAYNEYIFDGPDALKNRLRFHWNIESSEAAACTGCGHCEPLCTQKLPIVESLRKVAAM
jgi:predicted aldo/keto reductase-like oxidoreductase